MYDAYVPEDTRSNGEGYDRWNTSVCSSGVSIFLTAAQMYEADSPRSIVRSIAAFAASAVSGFPVWNVTPSWSSNVQVSPSSEDSHEVASSGSTCSVSALYRVSVSYMLCRAMTSFE